MAKARDVRRRIRSVDNTRQITRTMEMVAASKLKRATDRVRAARPYGDALEGIVRSLYDPALAERFPLLRKPDRVRRVAILLLTANRGLAGAFNANLIRQAWDLMEELRAQGIEVEVHVSGKRGIQYFQFKDEPLASSSTEVGDYPTVEDAERLVGHLRDRFVTGDLDGVHVVTSHFRSALSTPPVTVDVLPIEPGEGGVPPDAYILSPAGTGILEQLLPLYVRNTVYRALVENAAAEQGARRTAMKSATDNAGDMLETLTRNYNRARQGQITQQISEIVGGAEGLA